MEHPTRRRELPEEGKSWKRAYMFLGALVALGGAVYLTGQLRAQTGVPGTPGTPPATTPGAPPAATPPARTDKPRVAVFNVAKVMQDFEKWQYFAAVMSNKRVSASAELGKLTAELQDLDKKLATETQKERQEQIQKLMIDKKRALDDRERVERKRLDDESSDHLRNLFNDIDRAVKAIVQANGYDIVFAYPDAVSEEQAKSPLYFDIKMRPPAAIPFYVSPTVDMTPILIQTLNKSFPKPGPIPAPVNPTPTGGTGGVAPPAPAPLGPGGR